MGGPAWFSWPFLFHFCGNNVFSKADPGKTGMAWKAEAAETELALSIQHSWFYPLTDRGSPPGTLTGQAR